MYCTLIREYPATSGIFKKTLQWIAHLHILLATYCAYSKTLCLVLLTNQLHPLIQFVDFFLIIDQSVDSITTICKLLY